MAEAMAVPAVWGALAPIPAIDARYDRALPVSAATAARTVQASLASLAALAALVAMAPPAVVTAMAANAALGDPSAAQTRCATACGRAAVAEGGWPSARSSPQQLWVAMKSRDRPDAPCPRHQFR